MITETYRDVEIVLLEDENKWRFTANGRERSAPSLPKAREYIDNALDEVKSKKAKVWEPFEAYHKSGYSTDSFEKVTVTSEAESDRYSNRRQYWINNKNKDHRGHKEKGRSKVSATELYAITPDNDKLIAQLAVLSKESEQLEEKIRSTAAKVKQITVPKEAAA